MSYRTAQPTAQKASLRDARYRPTPWPRKVRRAWAESPLFDRRVLVGLSLVLSVSAVGFGVYYSSPLAVVVMVVGTVVPVTWGMLRGITNDGLSFITARATLRRERRIAGRYASTCGTCGSPSCPSDENRYSWADRLNGRKPTQAVR